MHLLTNLKMVNKSIYKTPEAKETILKLYDQKAASLPFPYQKRDIQTSFGHTRVLIAGNPNGEKIVLFHGVHAGAPLTLECVQNLVADYHLYAIDTIGQATSSADVTINIKDDSFARWADEVLDGLEITEANFVGISYGAFILQKLITHRPNKVKTCILIVPSGLANGDFWPSFKKLSIPLIRYQITKKDADLQKFIQHFVPEGDTYMVDFQRALLQGVQLDFRRPSILQPTDVAHFKNPVYIAVADDDVFFPAEKTVKQAKQVFPNLHEIHVLKDCLHMPHAGKLAEIEGKIREWVE